jgi:hypothetical protein
VYVDIYGIPVNVLEISQKEIEKKNRHASAENNAGPFDSITTIPDLSPCTAQRHQSDNGIR